MTSVRTPQTEQDSKDTELILYRLRILEAGVKDLGSKLDRQDNIKKSDLAEFKQFITDRMVEYRTGLQTQIDRLDEGKADRQELSDLKKQLAGYGAVALALAAALFSFMLQRIK